MVIEGVGINANRNSNRINRLAFDGSEHYALTVSACESSLAVYALIEFARLSAHTLAAASTAAAASAGQPSLLTTR